ncbi:Hypothetical predicted protein [Mytilus galloprovincialis]|uniref:Uncharacterized protein n=1 Tax=Mytilus galloprovincialis TaxID=29158 RepID=A0A8B6FQK4_MYTGA|nr:Hypothetical predicted protein [Mytilus galloprovincialis]
MVQIVDRTLKEAKELFFTYNSPDYLIRNCPLYKRPAGPNQGRKTVLVIKDKEVEITNRTSYRKQGRDRKSNTGDDAHLPVNVFVIDPVTSRPIGYVKIILYFKSGIIGLAILGIPLSILC